MSRPNRWTFRMNYFFRRGKFISKNFVKLDKFLIKGVAVTFSNVPLRIRLVFLLLPFKFTYSIFKSDKSRRQLPFYSSEIDRFKLHISIAVRRKTQFRKWDPEGSEGQVRIRCRFKITFANLHIFLFLFPEPLIKVKCASRRYLILKNF